VFDQYLQTLELLLILSSQFVNVDQLPMNGQVFGVSIQQLFVLGDSLFIFGVQLVN
jgi:hypothetical protein